MRPFIQLSDYQEDKVAIINCDDEHGRLFYWGNKWERNLNLWLQASRRFVCQRYCLYVRAYRVFALCERGICEANVYSFIR